MSKFHLKTTSFVNCCFSAWHRIKQFPFISS